MKDLFSNNIKNNDDLFNLWNEEVLNSLPEGSISKKRIKCRKIIDICKW